MKLLNLSESPGTKRKLKLQRTPIPKMALSADNCVWAKGKTAAGFPPLLTICGSREQIGKQQHRNQNSLIIKTPSSPYDNQQETRTKQKENLESKLSQMPPQSPWQWQLCQRRYKQRKWHILVAWNLGSERSAKPHLAGSRWCRLCSLQAIGVNAAVSCPFSDEWGRKTNSWAPKNSGPRLTGSDITLWTGVAKFTLKPFWVVKCSLSGCYCCHMETHLKQLLKEAREEQKTKILQVKNYEP